ncbi:MAG: hypothetical protein U0694_15370 [Anaerolineae bacterium]
MWIDLSSRRSKQGVALFVGIGLVLLGLAASSAGGTGDAFALVLLGLILILGVGADRRYSEQQQELAATPPAQEPEDPDRFPDLNSTFTYHTSAKTDGFPDLDATFTYGLSPDSLARRTTKSSPKRGTKPPPLSYPATPEASRPTWISHVRGHSVFPHALSALQAAEQVIDTAQPLAVDLGLIVFRDGHKPAIHRTLNLPTDADTVQPYLQLHVPLPAPYTSAEAPVNFEIRSSSGDIVFDHTQNVNFSDGLNLISPPARMPVPKREEASGAWELRIYIGKRLLARHRFLWGEAQVSTDVANALEHDGEIGDALSRLIAEQMTTPLSLDELLSTQDDTSEEDHA